MRRFWKFSSKTVMTWGKYKHKSVQWIIDNDPDYILWLCKTVKNISIKFDADIISFYKKRDNINLPEYRHNYIHK
jgi:hypothetical protein